LVIIKSKVNLLLQIGVVLKKEINIQLSKSGDQTDAVLCFDMWRSRSLIATKILFLSLTIGIDPFQISSLMLQTVRSRHLQLQEGYKGA